MRSYVQAQMRLTTSRIHRSYSGNGMASENGYSTEKVAMRQIVSFACISFQEYMSSFERIWPLYQKAVELEKNFKHIKYEWVPRKRNKEADALSRKAYEAALKSNDNDDKKPSKKSSSRKQKGRKNKALELVGKVEQISQSVFEVPSSSGKKTYIVDINTISCECPDNQIRGRKCKHIIAAEMYISSKKPKNLIV